MRDAARELADEAENHPTHGVKAMGAPGARKLITVESSSCWLYFGTTAQPEDDDGRK
ncbi:MULTISPECIES: hypothetical protein [unclassified Streptomyces]|uniref:hypothetical protein n=1 Tax=unclassified Streptomyces TaxID=2593676 RepID=UPI002F90D5BA